MLAIRGLHLLGQAPEALLCGPGGVGGAGLDPGSTECPLKVAAPPIGIRATPVTRSRNRATHCMRKISLHCLWNSCASTPSWSEGVAVVPAIKCACDG